MSFSDGSFWLKFTAPLSGLYNGYYEGQQPLYQLYAITVNNSILTAT